MMMTMIVFNKQQHISFVSKRLHLSEYKSKVELNNHSLARGQCRLLSDWYCIRCQNNKKYPPITILPNTGEYCPVPNNSIVLTLDSNGVTLNNVSDYRANRLLNITSP